MHVNAFLFLFTWRMLVTVSALLLLFARRMLVDTFLLLLLLLAWRLLASAFLLLGRAVAVLCSFKMSQYLRFGIEFMYIQWINVALKQDKSFIVSGKLHYNVHIYRTFTFKTFKRSNFCFALFNNNQYVTNYFRG